MRTTITALLCALSAAACAPIGESGGNRYDGADAGVDGSASTACDDYETRTLDLTISGAAGFTGLPASCWRLDGRLTLTGPAVTSLAKLGDLREVRHLVIDDTALTRIDTPSVIEVTGDVTIRNNDELTDIANVAVDTAASSITVEYNPQLTALGGLARANVISGATRIANNAKLATLDLGRATRLEGGLVVSDNAALTALDLHSLESAGAVTIRHNPALTSLGSLSALQFVHGTFTLDDNDSLVSLASAMTNGMGTIDLDLVITNNAKLQELGGLARTKYVGGGFTATGNSALAACEVREIDCCVDTGPVYASGNQTSSCNSNGYSWCYQQYGYCPYM